MADIGGGIAQQMFVDELLNIPGLVLMNAVMNDSWPAPTRAQFAEERALDEEFQELVTTSNVATDPVRVGRLEEAETLARDLLERLGGETASCQDTSYCEKFAVRVKSVEEELHYRTAVAVLMAAG